MDDRYFVCIKHIQADKIKKQVVIVEEKETEADEQKQDFRLKLRKRKSCDDSVLDSWSFQDSGMIGPASNPTRRARDVEPIEEGEHHSVSEDGIDICVFYGMIPKCMKCKETFDVTWSHKQGIFIAIHAEVHDERKEQVTEYRHKRGYCMRKRLRKSSS